MFALQEWSLISGRSKQGILALPMTTTLSCTMEGSISMD